MNELQVFTNDTFGEVRTVAKDNEPWFVAADVCRALELTNNRMAVDRLGEDEKADVSLTDTSSNGVTQSRTFTIINEAGLYTLVLGSRKPEARAFKRWITHEVVPTIRKHGMYATNELLDNPDLLIEAATRIKVQRQQIQQLEADKSALTVDLAIAQPKAAYFDELVDRNLLTGFRETAKLLKISEKKFVAFLIDHKYIYRDKSGKLCPKADKNDGLFEIKECYNEKTDWRGTQTLVTPKGRETFRLLCQGM